MLVVQDDVVIPAVPVKINLVGEGGEAQVVEISADIQLYSLEEYERYAAPSKAETMAAAQGELAANLSRFVRGWHGVVDADKQPIPFSEVAFKQVLHSPAGPALSRALWGKVHQIHLQEPVKN